MCQHQQLGLSELQMPRNPETRIVTRLRARGRGNGEGAIYNRLQKYTKRDGTVTEIERWCAAVTLPSGTRKVLYGRTREQVSRKLTKALGDLQVGVAPPDQRETIGSWLTAYVDDLEARGTANGTRRSSQSLVSHRQVDHHSSPHPSYSTKTE
jgi:hypothetical protein